MNIRKLDNDNLKLCADFLAVAKGANINSPSVSQEYLKWKYLSQEADENICLFLEQDGEICSIVGGIVWKYIVNGKELQVCFPVDWYSSTKSPVKGAGRRILKALMDQFPVSVAVGGTKICFEPQILVGFRDIGEVFLLGIEANKIFGLRDLARKTRNFILNPTSYFKGLRVADKFSSKNKVIFKNEEFSVDGLLDFKGWQFFSQNIERSFLIRRWKHYMLQPYNHAKLVSVRLRGRLSYLFISEFNDARKGYIALADALCDVTHSKEDILAAFVVYAKFRSSKRALFMTSDKNIFSTAFSLGYRICDRLRTQYYSLPDAPFCSDMRKCPDVFFLSGDELMYRRPGKQC